MNPNMPDSIALLRVYLQDKSTDELITLLLDLIQQVDEPVIGDLVRRGLYAKPRYKQTGSILLQFLIKPTGPYLPKSHL